MKKSLIIILMTMLVVSTNAQTGKLWYFNIDSQNVALNGYDPLTYFEKNGPAIGNKKLIMKYNDILYHFLNEKNRALFAKNPEKYLPKYGGWCAYRMAQFPEEEGWGQSRIPVSPENYLILNDDLYLFSNVIGDAKERWEAHEQAEMIARADSFWLSRVKLSMLSNGKPEGLNPNARMENLLWERFIGKWDGKGKALTKMEPKTYSNYPPATWTFKYGFNGFCIQDEWVPHVNMGGTWNGPAIRGFDPLKREWHMTFIPVNAGQKDIWLMTGKFNENYELEGFMEGKDAKGRDIQQRIYFYNINDNFFEWKADISYDQGKTWITEFLKMEVSRIISD